MDMKLPVIEPAIKLDPIMKLIGKSTVSLIKKFALDLLPLFWIPIINIIKIHELKTIELINFLRGNIIVLL